MSHSKLFTSYISSSIHCITFAGDSCLRVVDSENIELQPCFKR
jgi:hypothetical protein